MATQQQIVNYKNEEILEKDRVDNEAIAKKLKVGKTYRFDPRINTIAIPQAVKLNGLPHFDFQFADYLGMQDGRLVFEGYPVDAPEKTPEWKFFFFVSCVEGGAKMVPMRKIE